MSTYTFILIFIAGIFILWLLYKLFIQSSNDSEMRLKGLAGEDYTKQVIDNWISKNNLDACIYAYNTPKYKTQAIDLVLDSECFQDVGIEVKYRTIEKISYLKFEHISRFHQDGNRQSTKQLFGYIRQTNRLGLYAFVFVSKNQPELYFLPHYILEKMMRRGIEVIYITQIIEHAHGYHWTGRNQHFIRYIENEYDNQQKFFKKEDRPSLFRRILNFIIGR